MSKNYNYHLVEKDGDSYAVKGAYLFKGSSDLSVGDLLRAAHRRVPPETQPDLGIHDIQLYQIDETFDRTEPHAALRDVAKLYRGESLTRITSPHNLVVLYTIIRGHCVIFRSEEDTPFYTYISDLDFTGAPFQNVRLIEVVARAGLESMMKRGECFDFAIFHPKDPALARVSIQEVSKNMEEIPGEQYLRRDYRRVFPTTKLNQLIHPMSLIVVASKRSDFTLKFEVYRVTSGEYSFISNEDFCGASNTKVEEITRAAHKRISMCYKASEVYEARVYGLKMPYTGGLTGEKLRVFSDPLSYERELWEVGSKTLIVAFDVEVV